MTDEPVSPQMNPYHIEVEEGRKYMWCSCGRSKRQPFCDQSHKGTEFEPVEYVALKTETVFLCGCKQTDDAPFCDGTHNLY